jgi:hypothetical protein
MRILRVGVYQLSNITQADISSAAVVVLYIDEDFLRHRDLEEVLGWLTDRKGKNFRCYVYSQHCTPKEFIDWLATDEARDWADFSDVYHLSEERICTQSQLDEALSNVRKEFSNERRYRFHKRTLSFLQFVLGNVARLVQVLSLVFIFVLGSLGFYDFVSQNPAVELLLAKLFKYDNIVIPILIFSIMSQIVESSSPIFMKFRTGSENFKLLQKNFKDEVFGLIFYFLLIVFMIIYSVRRDLVWFSINNIIQVFLIFLTAVMVDSLQRLRYVARKTRIPLNITKDNYSHDIDSAEKLVEKSNIESLNNVSRRFAYRKKDVPYVFISYTHSSKVWTRERIKEYSYKIQKNRGNVFVDQVNISLGSNWRSALHNRMNEASIVLCFADEVSVTKGYCAAEIEAALRLRSKTNSPQIIIIADNDLDINEVPDALPIFRVLFGYEHHFRQPVRIIREDSGIPDFFWEPFGEPDITDSVLPEILQKIINMLSGICSLIIKSLLYFFGILILASSWKVGEIIRGVEISLPLYKILLPPYNTVLFELPVWTLFPLTFAVTYVFIWLWNDIFRIFKVSINMMEELFEYLELLLRLFVLLFGTAQLIRQVPALGLNGIMGLFLCVFLAISMSEDGVAFLITYARTRKTRSEAMESVVTVYDELDEKHIEFRKKCENYLSQRRVKEIWKEALAANDIIDDNGNEDAFITPARSFALLKDNSVLEKEVKEFEEILKSPEADGSSWSEIRSLQCLGESEFLLGRAEKAFEYLSRSTVYITFFDYMFRPTTQLRIMQTELEAAVALSHCEGRSEEAAARFKKLAYKCRQQLEMAGPYIVRMLLAANPKANFETDNIDLHNAKIDNDEDQLAVQWFWQADCCLNKIPDEYK